MKEPIIKRFEEEGNPYYSSARYLVRYLYVCLSCVLHKMSNFLGFNVFYTIVFQFWAQ